MQLEGSSAQAFVVGSYMQAHLLHVDRLPARGESVVADGHFWEHGGKGFNLGIGLRRLGVAVHLLLPVGSDAAGQAAAACAVQHGLPAEGVLELGAQSGFGVGFVDAAGDNFLATIAGANGLLDTVHIDAAEPVIAGAQWVCGQFEAPQLAVAHAFALARRHGASTYLNPSPWQPMTHGLLALTDVLVVNTVEAAALFDRPETEHWRSAEWEAALPALGAAIGWRGRLLVVTLGSNGCVALDAEGRTLHQPAHAITQRDATGAGDAFGCGLLQALLAGRGLREALHQGAACGALVASRDGVLAALPDAVDLAAFLETVAHDGGQRPIAAARPAPP